MPHFFISYAKKDTRDLAIQLEAALNALPNVTAWVDKSLHAGRSWELQIETEIRRCDYMLVLYSPDMNRHQHGEPESYMLSEIHYAKRTARKPIIPIMAQLTDPPMSLTMEQYIDFTLPNLSLNDLIAAICDEIGIDSSTSVGAQGLAPSVPDKTPSPRIEFPPTLKPIPPEPTLGTHIIDDKGVEMVYVPAGKFIMGSDDGRDNEKPVHEVQITKPFWIDLIPVTNAAYARFVNDGGYCNKDYWTKAGWYWLQKENITTPVDYGSLKEPQQPRVGISWYEASAYARWRGGRLATEAEWEWAARGPENRIHPWGEFLDVTPFFSEVSVSDIRSYKASWVGALDMSSDVWEWVSSLLKPYPYRVDDGRENQGDGKRILRGGHWYLNERYARSACRLSLDPYDRDHYVGFRIVRSPSNS